VIKSSRNPKALEVFERIPDIATECFDSSARKYSVISVPFLDWALREYRIKNEPLSFKGYRPLADIYRFNFSSAGIRKMVIQKAAQVGVSEHNIARTFYIAGVSGLVVMYVFPKKEQMGDFSRARVKPRLLSSPGILKLISKEDIDNVFMKQLGAGTVYFRGSQNYDSITSVDADVIILDEVDRFYAPHIEVLKARVSNSEQKFELYTSTPVYPGIGINSLYEESDMRRWFVKCPACGEWQSLDFEENIERLPEPHIACRKCREPFHDATNMEGEWIAEYPGRDAAGFHVTKLISGHTTASELVDRHDKMRNRQDFYNQWLGLPYKPPGSQLISVDIENCIASEKRAYTAPVVPRELGDCVAGFDVGRVIHYVILEKPSDIWDRPRLVDAGEIGDGGFSDNDYQGIKRLMESYSVNTAVIDAMPERRFSTRFINEFKKRAWEIFWGDGLNFKEFIRKDNKNYSISVNRTMALDMRTDFVKERRIYLPFNIEERAPGFTAQVTAQCRIKEEDEEGNITYKYINGGSADHYGDAFTYALLAFEVGIKYYPSKMFVISPEGIAAERKSIIEASLESENENRLTLENAREIVIKRAIEESNYLWF
jgi:hypothetical protein